MDTIDPRARENAELECKRLQSAKDLLVEALSSMEKIELDELPVSIRSKNIFKDHVDGVRGLLGLG